MSNPLLKTGLLDNDISLIRKGAEAFPEIERVILFGSRAKGNYKPGSDVDLAIIGKAVTYDTAVRLSVLFNEEMPLPYYFDVLNYNSIQEPLLIEHIDRNGVPLYQR